MKPDTINILITLSDGAVAVMTFVTEQHRSGADPGWKRAPTAENIQAEIKKAWSANPTAGRVVSWRRVEFSELPERTFRDAWRSDGERIEIDMSKAREIHRNRIRRRRDVLLQALDTQYIRADEMGNIDEKRRIAQEKQRLRDLPTNPAIDAARTPEELKAAWPEALKG